jgi:hypothetical protein
MREGDLDLGARGLLDQLGSGCAVVLLAWSLVICGDGTATPEESRY